MAERVLVGHQFDEALAAVGVELADLVVLSENLLTVPDDDLLDTEVVMTIIGGQVRFRDGEIVPIP